MGNFYRFVCREESTSNLLSLTRRAQDAVLELDITKLNSVTGVKELIAKLDRCRSRPGHPSSITQ